MTFKSKIFHPDNKWYNKYSLSEKLFALSMAGILIAGIIIAITDGRIENYLFNLVFQIFMFVTIGFLLLNMIIRHFEYETFNGKFGEDMTLNADEIILNNQSYQFSDIKEIELQIQTFYGMKTNNRKLGPAYHQGVNNKISFRVNNKIIQTFFLIKSKEQLQELHQVIFKIIRDEKLKFKYKYLDYITDNFKKTNEYSAFIQKLKTENRLLVK